MISIVVPAHNERSVIGRTLRQWTDASRSGEFDIVVVCNGCADDTAEVARQCGAAVKVLETDVASKTIALNLGDQAARGFPRFYVDADVLMSPDTIRTLAARLNRGDVLAAAPTADIDLSGCSWLVRRYYNIRARLPSAREGVGGSGVYAVSEQGRSRFGEFPVLTADDTYVRLQFMPAERVTLPEARSTIFPPRGVTQLIAIRTRVHRGTLELVRLFPDLQANNGERNDRALLALFREPRLWPGLIIYCWVNLLARRRAARHVESGAHLWQRDDSSRVALSAGPSK